MRCTGGKSLVPTVHNRDFFTRARTVSGIVSLTQSKKNNEVSDGLAGISTDVYLLLIIEREAIKSI